MFYSKMKLNLALSFYLIYVSSICTAENYYCEHITELSGVIRDSHMYKGPYEKCWIITVPEGNYLTLVFEEMKFRSWPCELVHLKYSVIGTDEEYMFCSQDSIIGLPGTVWNDVRITYYHRYFENYVDTSFKLHYTIEIGLTSIPGLKISRENVITWLKNQRTDSYGWGKNTHRAITALSLSGDEVREEILQDSLLMKQLELQTALALIRNPDDPISINELSMFVNALSVTCHRPQHFYGHDLLEILSEKVRNLSSPSPGALLTLCNANWTISDAQIESLLDILSNDAAYPFHLDIQAMSLMALSCIRTKIDSFYYIENATEIYNDTVDNFMSLQQNDSSFGNVYTTAVVTQALLSCGEEKNRRWDSVSAVQYLMKKLNSSSIDFLSAYFVAPIFNGKSLVDIKDVWCEKHRKGENAEISDIVDKSGAKMQVKYCIYFGDKNDLVQSIYLKMPQNSSAFDIMRMAQVVNHKYKFLYNVMSGHVYVYDIEGVTNDPETGKFWLTYFRNSSAIDTLQYYIESPDTLFLNDGDELVMWYKTAHM